MALSAGGRSRLIKQHYCRRSIVRQTDVLSHIPAYLFQIFIKSSFILSHKFESMFVSFFNLYPNFQMKWSDNMWDIVFILLSRQLPVCFSYCCTRVLILLDTLAKYALHSAETLQLCWIAYQKTFLYLILVKQEAICNADRKSVPQRFKVGSWFIDESLLFDTHSTYP